MNYDIIKSPAFSEDWVEQVLLNRGLEEQSLWSFMNPSSGLEHNYLELDYIKDAVKRVAKAIASQEKVYVQVDCDCDGYTSAASLLNYLWFTYPFVIENNWTWGLHSNKEHGIEEDNIPEGTTLVIAPDSSSNEVELHLRLAARSIDVVILDHHEAPFAPEDPAIIVNNQIDKYPNKTLCGAGIVYKFCECFDDTFGLNQHENILDLTALGLIGDMMDMRNLETRYLINEGLVYPENPYFASMISKQQYQIKDELTPFNVAFYIVPFINAITRVGTAEEKELIFEALLNFRARTLIQSTKRGDPKGTMVQLVEQAVRVCTNVKARQEREKKNTVERIEGQIAKKQLLKNPVIILEMKDPIDANLTGLVANYVMAKYQKPTLLLNWRSDHWAGSGRAFPIAEIENWRGFFESDCSVIYAQGHANAFGIAMTAEQLEQLKKQMKTWPWKIEPIHWVDFKFDANDGDLYRCIMALTERQDLWGQGVTEPEIAVEHVKIDPRQIHLYSPDKNPTIKFDLPHGVSAMIFGTTEEEYNKLLARIPDCGAIELTVLGKCARNTWQGTTTAQIFVSDYEVTNVIDLDF